LVSRKTFLKKISPHKGTGRYLQYLRCPCCGKLARGPAIGNAGTHLLSLSQCTGPKGGYRAGFNWEHRELDGEMLGVLEESLERALVQVRDMLGKADVVLPQEVLAEYHLLPQVLSEWIVPGNELEVFYGNGEDQEEGQEGEVVHPARVRLNRV